MGHTKLKGEPTSAATGQTQNRSNITGEDAADVSLNQGTKRSQDGSPKSPSKSGGGSSPIYSKPEQKHDGQAHEKGVETMNNGEKANEAAEIQAQQKKKIKNAMEPSSFYAQTTRSTSTSHQQKSAAHKASQTMAATFQVPPKNRLVHSEINSTRVNGMASPGVHGLGSPKTSPLKNASKSLGSISPVANGLGSPAKQRPNPTTIKSAQRLLEVKRKSLPIWSHKTDIRWSLRHSDVLLLVGETGSGKSTQVPQFLMEEPWCKKEVVEIAREDGESTSSAVGGTIAITEPRRVAATSLANRVARECGSHLGRGTMNANDKVGYNVRFDRVIPKNAKIVFLTEGMLLKELQSDPDLRKYSAVIVDEIHERSIDVDLLIGFLRNIVKGNKKGRGGIPLKLIIMSATANMEGLYEFFTDDSHSPLPESQRAVPNIQQSYSESSQTINGSDSSKTLSVSEDDRRRSNSYSSWDGISSEEEKLVNGSKRSKPNGVAAVENYRSHNNDSRSKISQGDIALEHIEGSTYAVKIFYTPAPVSDYLQTMLETIFKVHTQEPLPGDILAFLTGQEEIESLQRLVEEASKKLPRTLPKIQVLPLFGHMTMEQQNKAFEAPQDKKTRKVILATNIAETSITVPGVRFVIDCGKAKIKQYRGRLGLESLLVKPISKSSAIQRKGRAGREAPGKCYRLYTESEYLKLAEDDVPEILRSNITQALLTMKSNKIDDIMAFPLMDRPDPAAIEKGMLTLHMLGALDDEGGLTEIGAMMSDFPLQPEFARVLIAASEPDVDCVLEAVDVIACLTSSDNIFIQPKSEEGREESEESRRDLIRREGDILTYLTTMQRYVAEDRDRVGWCKKHHVSSRDMKYACDVRSQLRRQCVKSKLVSDDLTKDKEFVPLSPERAEILIKCFLKALVMQTAVLHPDGSYKTARGSNVVAIHPSSVLHGKKMEAIMFLEHVYTQKSYVKKVSAIQMDWIEQAMALRATGSS